MLFKRVKLNYYILSFILLIFAITIVGDTIKYQDYSNTLSQNFINKYVNVTQQIREDYRLLFDKLQYDFNKTEANNVSKINQLYELYKNDSNNFNIESAVNELNKDVSFGSYQIFLINKDYIIEQASYKNDIGYNLGQYKVLRNLFDSIFNKKVAIDISPIKIDSSSMQFKRYLLKRSNDGKYLLQIAFVLDFFKELKHKYLSIKDWGQLELYLATENIIQKIEFEKQSFTKQSLELGWKKTKFFLSQLVNDLRIKKNNITVLLNSNINDKKIQVNSEIDKLFTDDKLAYKLDLSKHQLSIYSITDGLFNKSIETKLIIKSIYNTKELADDLQSTLNHALAQILFILITLGFIYLFIIKNVSNKLLKIIDNIKNNRYSNVLNIKTMEIEVLNNCYNEMHNQLNHKIEANINLLNENKRFIADTVHQIRTPLTNIMMNSEMVKMLQTDDSLSSYIEKIDSSINMLSNSYEDLAYIITADSIDYEPSIISLSDILNKRIDFFATISRVNQKEIKPSIQSNISTYINTIELERLIDNNIANGIKYGLKNNPIIINLLKNANSVVLEFKTTGEQIQNKSRIFEKNYRENEAKRGLGLGLNMVKGICEKYQISYSVDYIDGQNVFTYIFEVS
ncbi:MAG: HAMP domain-containing histidine kinase [Gammaproteobacteria bacterium]|nr:HAMP domain-containing histidine kinase [Gammaproteobacteria bacterium]